MKHLAYSVCSVVSDFVALWTVAHQAPQSTGFSWQEYWGGLDSLLQGTLPTRGSNLCFLHLQHWRVDSLY